MARADLGNVYSTVIAIIAITYNLVGLILRRVPSKFVFSESTAHYFVGRIDLASSLSYRRKQM